MKVTAEDIKRTREQLGDDLLPISDEQARKVAVLLSTSKQWRHDHRD